MKHNKKAALNFDNGAAERTYASLKVSQAASLDWCEEALEAVVSVALRQEEFTTDDVWELVGPPPNPRNMGNVMRKATKLGHAEAMDQVVRGKDTRRGVMIRVWRSLIFQA